jgi:hypothetical protein
MVSLNNLLILPAIVSSFSELFPEYGMSYWKPRTRSVQFYDKVYYRRVLAVILTWVPITLYLLKLSPCLAPLAVTFIMLAFYTRRKYEYANGLYVVGLILISWILFINNLSWNKIVLSGLLIITGGYLIQEGRTGKLEVDILGRVLFSSGFVFFIINLKSL